MYWNVCLMVVTVTETCSKLHIIEYIVMFWLNDILVNGIEIKVSSAEQKWFSNIYPTRCNVTQFILSGNCSTCFGWYHHPSSGAQTTVSTASGICHAVTSTCCYSGRWQLRHMAMGVRVTDFCAMIACRCLDLWTCFGGNGGHHLQCKLPWRWSRKFLRIIHNHLTHCGRVKQFCVFNTVKLGTSASSP